jgi:hypothetical protein
VFRCRRRVHKVALTRYVNSVYQLKAEEGGPCCSHPQIYALLKYIVDSQSNKEPAMCNIIFHTTAYKRGSNL